MKRLLLLDLVSDARQLRTWITSSAKRCRRQSDLTLIAFRPKPSDVDIDLLCQGDRVNDLSIYRSQPQGQAASNSRRHFYAKDHLDPQHVF